MATITKVIKNGAEYTFSAEGIEQGIASAQESANNANNAMVQSQNIVTSTQELIGGKYIPTFDKNVPNAITDLVFHDGKIYRALAAHISGDDWNPANWFQTSYYLEIKDIRSGSNETVVISASSWDGAAVLEGVEISIKILSTSQVITKSLDSLGQCQFIVPKMETFTIIAQDIAGYRSIPQQTMVAVANSQVVPIKYERPNDNVEVVKVLGLPRKADGSAVTPSPIDGLIVTLTTSQGDVYQQEFSNNECQFQVDYGTEYHISAPSCDGYHILRSDSSEFVAGRPENVIAVMYRENVIGLYAIDANGNLYTEAQVDLMTDSEKALMQYIGLNTSALQTANSGFMFRMVETITSKQWSNQNVEFDHNILPYKTNATQAAADYNGHDNTDKILAIIQQTSMARVTAPAASYCRSLGITIGSGETAITKYGYLPAAGQWQTLKLNWTSVSGLIMKLGHTPHNIMSGGWWSSSQFSQNNAWNLTYGSLDYNRYKNAGFSVLPFFDF